ncbi:MAG: HNH endonuclease [Gammaproteobacteria bacterium]|nr:HNH endonuclease [Gammaproteobacteria bacterium]
MIATIDAYDRVPHILRLDISGRPVDWVRWKDAVCLYARDIVVWTLGDPILRLRGGHCRQDGSQSIIDVNSIIACSGEIAPPRVGIPPLTNAALFSRDRHICLYCGGEFPASLLSRDHVVPTSRGGKDVWDNCVAACKRCNHAKGDRLMHEWGRELLALPYAPNFAEYLALINSGRILGDQMDFLRRSFGARSRANRRFALEFR